MGAAPEGAVAIALGTGREGAVAVALGAGPERPVVVALAAGPEGVVAVALGAGPEGAVAIALGAGHEGVVAVPLGVGCGPCVDVVVSSLFREHGEGSSGAPELGVLQRLLSRLLRALLCRSRQSGASPPPPTSLTMLNLH